MSEDKKFEMMKTLKERQDKFIYYIAGINIAAIGFSLSKITDSEKISMNYIFLGIALVVRLVSTAMSFSWILAQFRTMECNMEILDLVNGHYDKSVISEQEKKRRISDSYSRIQKDALRCERDLKGMMLMFIIGIVSYMIRQLMIITQ